MHITVFTFALGVVAATLFAFGHLLPGAVVYFLCFLSDGTDGKLQRVLGRDDTYRGIIDFILDGIVCIAVIMGLALNGDKILLLMLLLWMGIHYFDMRMTSAAYRLKVQFGISDVWLISPEMQTTYDKQSKGLIKWILGTYHAVMRRLQRLRTYPHPTVGEAVMLIFVVGPIVWWATGSIVWIYAMSGLGILFIIPETVGALLIAYVLASEKVADGPGE